MSLDTLTSSSPRGIAFESDTNEARVRWLRRLDRVGIGLSGLCAVHCALLPILMMAVPFVGGHEFEEALRFGLAGIGVVSVAVGFSVHRKMEVGVWLAAALVLFAVLSVVEFSLAQEIGVSLLASAALIRAHWLNSRSCRSEACAHPAG